MSTTELIKKETPKTSSTIKEWLNSDALKQQIARAMPKHCDADTMCRVALTTYNRTPGLQKCTVESFMEALLTLSQWGLTADNRHAHLIPYGNKCQLILDYKGLITLAYRSGYIENVHSEVICENDEFTYDTGKVSHKVDFKKKRGDVYAVFCVVALKDGAQHVEVMSKDEIEAIRKRSKAGQSGPWVTDWNEMAKKTVFRRASKWIPLSADVAAAFDGDDDKLPPIAFHTAAEPASIEHLEAILGGGQEAIQ